MSDVYEIRRDRVTWSESGAQLILLSLDDSTYLSLNGSAAALWQRLATSPATVDALADALVAEFGIDADVAATDAAEFVADVVDRGLVAAGPATGE